MLLKGVLWRFAYIKYTEIINLFGNIFLSPSCRKRETVPNIIKAALMKFPNLRRDYVFILNFKKLQNTKIMVN